MYNDLAVRMLKKMTLARKYKNAIRVGVVLYKAVQLFVRHCSINTRDRLKIKGSSSRVERMYVEDNYCHP